MNAKLCWLSPLCVVAAAAIVGCGGGDDATPSSGSPSDAAVDADAATGQDAPSEASPSEAGNDQEAGDCKPNSLPDDPDDQGLDTNCDGADGVVGDDVYVDPTNGDDTNAGTPSSPFKSLAKALSVGDRVLISGGALSSDTIVGTTPQAVFGGYSSTFLGAPDRSRTIVQVDANGLLFTGSSTVALHHVTVEGASATSSEQRSAHGLVFDVEEAVLDDVEVNTGDALPGAAGTAGDQGLSGTGATGHGALPTTCDGVLQPAYVGGADGGKPSLEGKPAGNLNTKVPPSPASAGAPGTAGQNAPGEPGLVSGMLAFAGGTDGSSDGKAGMGGAGGGGISTSISVSGKNYQVYGGGGGSGGCPGTAGLGAESGGGAVAVLMLRGHLVVSRSRLGTGFGGTGGDGGLGGAGGKGGAAGLPTVYENCYSPQTKLTMPATCNPATDSPLFVNCAEYGAPGGDGGLGGHGGGGAGGWTLGVLTTGSATADVSSDTAFDLGKVGTGGMGAFARAPDGQKSPTHHIP